MWRNPAAWLGLAAVAAPIVVHLLVRARARPVDFPSLRFVPAVRLAALRARTTRDWALLLVRVSIVVAAVAALADPVFVTAARRAEWSRRTARAVVIDGSSSMRQDEPAGAAAASSPLARARARAGEFTGSAFVSTVIEAARLDEGIARAAAWLATSPPAAREIVVISDAHEGSMNAATFRQAPAATGIRIVTVATDASQRVVRGPAAIGGSDGVLAARTPVVTITRDRVQTVYSPTLTNGGAALGVTDGNPLESGLLSLRIDVGGRDAEAATAALRAVAELGAPIANATGGSVAIVFPSAPDLDAVVRDAARPADPSMAARLRRIADDRLLLDSMRDEAPSTDAPRSIGEQAAEALVRNGAGEPMVFATSARAREGAAAELRLVARVAPSSYAGAALIRAAAKSGENARWIAEQDVNLIPRQQLDRWERPAATLSDEAVRGADVHDGRWLWAAALILLAIETWLRRSQPARDATINLPHDHAA